jgi:large subunit ribosomal protein L6
MSRVKSYRNSKDVSITINKDYCKRKNGTLERTIVDILNYELTETQLVITRQNETKSCRSLHGLTRALIQNMVTGVNETFTKTLIAEGVGYKFQVDKAKIILNVGFSHPVEFPIPPDLAIKAEIPKNLY